MEIIKEYKPMRFFRILIFLALFFIIFAAIFFYTKAATIEGLIMYLTLMAGVVLLMYRRKVTLYDDRIEIMFGFERKFLLYKDIKLICKGKYRPRFMRYSMPSINFITNNIPKGDNFEVLVMGKELGLLYKTFKKDDILEIIQFVTQKNCEIQYEKDIISSFN